MPDHLRRWEIHRGVSRGPGAIRLCHRGTVLRTAADRLAPQRALSVRDARSEAGVDRFGLEGEDGEDALVHAPQRLAARRTRSRASSPSANSRSGQRALVPEAALAQPVEVAGLGVLRAVDDAQVLPAAALHARAGPGRVGPRRQVASGLTTMPSPPAAVSSSHQRVAGADGLGVGQVDHAAGGWARSASGRRPPAGRPASRCQACVAVERGRAPSAASSWNGASAHAVERRRPASSSAGRRRRTPRRSPRRGRVRSSRSPTSSAAARPPASSASTAAGSAARRGRADRRRTGRASSSSALADQGSSSASSSSQSVSSSSQSPARVDRRAQPVEQLARSSVGEERPAGAGVDDAGRRRRHAEPAPRRVGVAADQRRPPASPCASPRRPPAATPSAR